jgi:predicted DNA-binding transcriptional regulator AlpA
MHAAGVIDRAPVRQSPQESAPRSGGPLQPTSTPPIEPLWNERQLGEFFGTGPRKTHQIRQEPDFPDAVVLGARCLRWLPSEVREWAQERAARASVLREPEQLVENRQARKVLGEVANELIAAEKRANAAQVAALARKRLSAQGLAFDLARLQTLASDLLRKAPSGAREPSA